MIVSGYLWRSTLSNVEECMLGGTDSYPETPHAACHISDGDSPNWQSHSYLFDKSFSGQMAALHQEPQAIDPQLSVRPEAFLVTANSAVPVADSIRGYYDEIGESTPFISYIKAGRKTQYQYEDLGEMQDFDDEVERLDGLIAGAEHVCVVEQFSDKGKSLQYAGKILEAVGVQNASAIRGKWYHDVWWPNRTIDLESVTSKYHDHMNRIGHLAAQRIDEY